MDNDFPEGEFDHFIELQQTLVSRLYFYMYNIHVKALQMYREIYDDWIRRECKKRSIERGKERLKLQYKNFHRYGFFINYPSYL